MKTEKLLEALKSVHGTRLLPKRMKVARTKIYNAVSANRRRSSAVGLPCTLTNSSVEDHFIDAYGTLCRYCGTQLTLKNMVYDHIRALSRGFPSDPMNMQWICKTCNTRKGPMDHDEYIALLRAIRELPEIVQKYIFHKLSQRTKYA